MHDKSLPSEWQHVKSKDNPVDLIFRGAAPEQVIEAKVWWGPNWLKEDISSWSKESKDLLPEQVLEKRKQIVITVMTLIKLEPIIEYKSLLVVTQTVTGSAIYVKIRAQGRL